MGLILFFESSKNICKYSNCSPRPTRAIISIKQLREFNLPSLVLLPPLSFSVNKDVLGARFSVKMGIL